MDGRNLVTSMSNPIPQSHAKNEEYQQSRPSESRVAFRVARAEQWDTVALNLDKLRWWGKHYQSLLAKTYQFVVPSDVAVLELGCGQGDLLSALKPELGVGIDISIEMLRMAKSRHPHLEFIQADAQFIPFSQDFDAVILSDLANDLWDVQTVFENLQSVTHSRTRIILNTYSRLWELPLSVAQSLRLAKPVLEQNWFTVDDLNGLFRIAGFEVIRVWQEIMFPLRLPLLSPLANRVMVRFWPLRHLAMTNFIIARLSPKQIQREESPSMSVIVPARNEAGNIAGVFERLPSKGRNIELIFVEGHSQDQTWRTIGEEIRLHPDVPAQLFKQDGVGKADAVRLGFAHARGDMLAILDADLSVAPEDLPRFFDVLVSGEGEFVNGVRLTYPMEREAMRFSNLLGNKLFGWAFSWLLGQKIRDTLCGTKVLWKSDYDRIAENRSYFGDFDPFGDFDLLFGAAKLNLRIVDLPIRYRRRRYGQTNIQRWRHGWLLLRMVIFAMRRLKFV